MISTKPRPPKTPFQHENRCRTPDALPEWIPEGGGYFTRACTCTVEHWHQPPEPEAKLEITPDMHRHEPDCDATAKVVTDEQTGERYTRCWNCMTSSHYLDLRHMDARQRREYMTGLCI